MDKNTVYVVSGFMRTGTSMMMKALEAGGMDAVRAESRDAMRRRHADADYDPNRGGLYELDPSRYREPTFPARYRGRLIKALNMGVPRMAVMDAIRVVFMRRAVEEVRQSCIAFFGRAPDVTDLDARMEDRVARIANRRDVVSLDVFWYRQVVERPLPHFQQLRAHGWPVNPLAAARTVDPDLCRYRLENLTVAVL